MQKNLLAVAVAAALAAPAVAMAQSSVTISGALNLWVEQAGATGSTAPGTATATSFDVKPRSRMQDGAGSNIRFTAVEDIGGGLQGFGQVESAVFTNADTRTNTLGAAGSTGGWGTRNSGVGLRGSAWGEILLGIWDIHYQESYAVDNQIITGASHTSSLALLNTFGTPGWSSLNPTIGGRLNNVVRYASPNWGGFTFNAEYSRPTDGLVSTAAVGGVALPVEGKKNAVMNIAPKFNMGGLHVGYSWYQDKDLTTTANATGLYNGASNAPAGAAGMTAAGSVNKITSNRFQAAYTFPFGLKIGAIYDRSKWEAIGNTVAALSSELKRDVWSVPLSYAIGPHTVFATYAKANKLKGNIGGADLSNITVTPVGGTGQTMDSGTGAKFYSFGYQFALSKRTNIHMSYSQVKNDSLAGYDFFSNTVGMANGNYGADPKSLALGIRHTF